MSCSDSRELDLSDRTALPDATRRASRLPRTHTLAGEAYELWCRSELFMVGAGNEGSRFATEAVRSGVTVTVCDPAPLRIENLSTQNHLPRSLAARCDHAGPAPLKVDSVVESCTAIRPGSARGLPVDVRNVGIGDIATADLLVDASDDPALALPLTIISNGLQIPLIRLALDGSGERELGRVLVSHGGRGHACQLCTYREADVSFATPRTPCPILVRRERPPTLAGGALGMAIAGLALIQAQRVVGGNDRDLALDREVLLDLTGMQTLAVSLRRSPGCLSRHASWEWQWLEETVELITPRDLLARGRDHFGAREVELEFFAHPLSLESFCACGQWRRDLASALHPAPPCACGRPMTRREDLTGSRFNLAQTEALGISDAPLFSLGLPHGVMVILHHGVAPPLRLVLAARRTRGNEEKG